MDNIILYVAIGIAIAIGAVLIYFAVKYPSKVVEWLVYAVTEAEKELGSGTGQLKLRAVYDRFLAKFPKLSVIVPFGYFSHLVDLALEEMRKMLENPAVKSYVAK